ncbi:MAG: hypothetical protein ACREJ3_18395 [Polyangiaceae bacterium]
MTTPRAVASCTRRRLRALSGGIVALALMAAARSARAEAPPGRIVIDRDVARFYAPETGGAAHPRFVDERTLAFETRLEAMAARSDETGDYPEELVRSALDHHIAEELLASLARKLIDGSLPAKRPSDAELARIGEDLGLAWFARLGGRARVDAAAAAEGLDATEVDALVRRLALAAFYLDRAVSPILKPSEESLRDAFRSTAQPFAGRAFEDVRPALARWVTLERVRSAEAAFFQTARSRVVVVVTR